MRHVNPRPDAGQSTSFERDGYDEYSSTGCWNPRVGGHGDVIPNAPVDGLYEGSNGRYYTHFEVTRNLRTDRWKPCIRQRDPDRRLVETSDGHLLLLTPTDEVPSWIEIRIDDRGPRVVDRRRRVPTESVPE